MSKLNLIEEEKCKERKIKTHDKSKVITKFKFNKTNTKLSSLRAKRDLKFEELNGKRLHQNTVTIRIIRMN